MLLAVNSSVNFIIYFLVGNKFREILARQCGCERRSHPRLGGPTGVRFLQAPESYSAAGFTSVGVDGGSFYGDTVDRPNGFIWSSRRASNGRCLAPRSPTTEPGVWARRPTITGGLLAVPRGAAGGPFGMMSSPVELEISLPDTTTTTVQDLVDEVAVSEQVNNDKRVDTSDICQTQRD